MCPECANEWGANAGVPDGAKVYKDSVGNVLQDGDTVTVIKDLKLKGSSMVVKVGTRVKNIRLVDSDHDIDCKIDGIGAMSLKSEFVKNVVRGWPLSRYLFACQRIRLFGSFSFFAATCTTAGPPESDIRWRHSKHCQVKNNLLRQKITFGAIPSLAPTRSAGTVRGRYSGAGRNAG